MDRARCIAVDASGNVYVAGESDNGKGNGTSRLSGTDIAIIKYGPDGKPSPSWPNGGFGVGVRRYNNPTDGEDRPVRMLVTPEGELSLTGCSLVARIIGKKAVGCEEWITQRYHKDGNLSWTLRESSHGEYGAAPGDMVLDPLGNLIVTGSIRTDRQGMPNEDILTVKYSPQGDTIWRRAFGGKFSTNEYARAIALSPNGSVTIAADTTPGNREKHNGEPDFIMVKYSASGDEIAARCLELGNTHISRIAVDLKGNFATTGTMTGAYYVDYLTLKFRADCTPHWSRAYNGPGCHEDASTDIKTDDVGNMIVTGRSYGGDNHIPGATNMDCYTIKYSPDGRELWCARYDHHHLDDQAFALALDGFGNTLVAAMSGDTNSKSSIVLIKYPPMPNSNGK